jgi:hypothetical protein
LGTVSGRVVELIDGFVQLWVVVAKEDIVVGGIDGLDICLLEDFFKLPSERYKGDDLEVATDEGTGTRG